MASSKWLLAPLLLALVGCASGSGETAIESSRSRASSEGLDAAIDAPGSSGLIVDADISPNAPRANPRAHVEAQPETRDDEALRAAALEQARKSGVIGNDPSPADGEVPVPKLHIVKTLEATGHSVSTGVGPGGQYVRFSAQKAGRRFTVTYAPPSSGADALSPKEKSRLNRDAKVFTSGNLFLAVESDDEAASQALLDTILGKP